MPYADVETSSEDYARRFSGAVGAWFLEVQAGITLDLLRAFPGASVLDVGGGHGQTAGPLAEAGYDVTVLGSAEACAHRLRRLLEAGRARFRCGDLLAAPFPDRAFDVVLSYRLLPHLDDWPRLVAELGRLARRAVLVDYPTRRSFNLLSRALFGAKRRVEGDTRRYAVFRDAEIAAAFAGAGYRISARRPEFFLPMAFHRAAGSAPTSRALEAVAGGLGLRRLLGSPVILRAERLG